MTKVAGVVIEKKGKYLLVQEKQKRAYKLWNLPAGRMDDGESLEDAAAREASEETGFDVKVIQLLGEWRDESTGAMLYAYSADIVGGELSWPEDEILDAQWFSLEEIETLQNNLRHPWVIESIRALHN